MTISEHKQLMQFLGKDESGTSCETCGFVEAPVVTRSNFHRGITIRCRPCVALIAFPLEDIEAYHELLGRSPGWIANSWTFVKSSRSAGGTYVVMGDLL